MCEATFEPDPLAKLKEQAKNISINEKSIKKFNKYNVAASVRAMQQSSNHLFMGMVPTICRSQKY